MRIAVAGTHRNGKTTLVRAAAGALPGFTAEPEPYARLLDSGEDFVDHGDPEFFVTQLRYLVRGLATTSPSDNIVFDRSPLDFAAYIMASDELRLGHRQGVIEPEVLDLVSDGMANLELIALLPLRPEGRPRARPSFRRLADACLCDIVRSDSLGVLGEDGAPGVVELTGSTDRRLADLMRSVERHVG